jgi:membrane dipeptidase
LNRRKAILATAAATIITGLQKSAKAQVEDTVSVSPATRTLYECALVFDANCGAPLPDNLPIPQDNLDLVRNSGVTAVKTSLGGVDSSFEDTVAEIAFYQRFIEMYPAVFLQVRKYADFATAKREKRFGIVFSFESVAMLADKPERIDLFRGLGVRVMQLSYNKASPFGAGVLAHPPTGLTELGRKAVERMNKNGVAIDISHANIPTSLDVLQLSARPALITHAGCMAIHKHPRNKPDSLLRAVADKGGVVGIYDLPYLTASPRQPTLDDYMAHMTHALKVCGEDHVGIGSDSGLNPWDTSAKGQEDFRKMLDYRKKAGVAAPEEDRPMYVIGLNTPRRCEVIADSLMKRGYSERVAEKVLGLNFTETLGRIWLT